MSDFQRKLSALWTTQDVARLFDVTPMTVHLWRLNRGLPTVVIPGTLRNAVRFEREAVLAWACARNVRMRMRLRDKAA